MRKPAPRSGSRVCSSAIAAILLATLALSVLHADASHCQTPSRCLACHSLHAPAMAQEVRSLASPPHTAGTPVQERAARLVHCDASLLSLLRAPPSTAAL